MTAFFGQAKINYQPEKTQPSGFSQTSMTNNMHHTNESGTNLKVFLSVEGYWLCFDFAIFDVYFVAT